MFCYGGESVEPVSKTPSLASIYWGYGCINVEIKGKVMNVEYYSDTNYTIDKFLITKNQPDPKTIDEKTELQQIEYYESQK